MFKNYLFDLYGTLIDIRTDEKSPELWQKLAIFYGYKRAVYTAEEIRAKYHELSLKEKKRVGKLYPNHRCIDINLTNVFRQLYELRGVEVSDEYLRTTASFFRCTSTKKLELYPGVIDLLETLMKKGRKIYLVSNAQHDFTMPEIIALGIDKYFDYMLISSDVFCSKPDPHIYELLFERFDLKKSESVMIGNDCYSDIESAHEFGIKSLYIDQEISSPIKGKLKSDFSVMDGDVTKIKDLIIK